MKTVAPFGSWKSVISPQLVTSGTPTYDFLQCGDNSCLYWHERRPWENGRGVVVQKNAEGLCRDILPSPLSALSRVHEYGGLPFVVAEGVLYFVLYDDQRIYALEFDRPGTAPRPLTPEELQTDDEAVSYRFAELQLDKSRRRLIAVCEAHSPGWTEAKNYLATIPLDGSQQIESLVEGDDFYACPRLDPWGNRLCWLSWNHPDMPWDRTCLSIASIASDGRIGRPLIVADSEEESIFQPQWSPEGELIYASDRSGWWNLYRYSPKEPAAPSPPLVAMEAEFAAPLWLLGLSYYGFFDAGHLVAAFCRHGLWRLGIYDFNTGDFTDLGQSFSTVGSVCAADGLAWFVGSTETQSNRIFDLPLDGGPCRQIISHVDDFVGSDCLSVPEAIAFPTDDDDLCHGFYYPPANPEFTGPDNQRPPLLVMCHGGPTAATSSALNYKVQYWTSRGFAVLDVNYRGSTGYGRAYREKLTGNWGIADVSDAAHGAEYLAKKGLADGERLIIRGSSAGGYTALAALTFIDTFSAGASLYGIGDLEDLVRETHKFEARYLDKLLGPYPEARQIYLARSPIYHAESLNCPVIFMQGLIDRIVPPEQAESMIRVLKDNGIPVAWLTFANEGHGFQHAINIHRALEAELFFYGKVFGFSPADSIKPLTIYNL